jgi:hypothetical protein
VVRKSLKKAPRGFDDSSSPSAKTHSRDILFPPLISGRNPAECGHSWQIVRTTRPPRQPYFGPFFVSPGSRSPRQPNHGHFGTDVETSMIQGVEERPKGVGFVKTPLRRSEQGSNYPVQRVPLQRRLGGSTRAADMASRWPGRQYLTRNDHWSGSPDSGSVPAKGHSGSVGSRSLWPYKERRRHLGVATRAGAGALRAAFQRVRSIPRSFLNRLMRTCRNSGVRSAPASSCSR